MRNLRSYYSATIAEFLQQSDSEILGIIHSNDISAETTIQQSNTWESEVHILKNQLRSFSDGRIIFEYTIPRMGKRVDTVVLYKNIVFLLEFSVLLSLSVAMRRTLVCPLSTLPSSTMSRISTMLYGRILSIFPHPRLWRQRKHCIVGIMFMILPVAMQVQRI